MQNIVPCWVRGVTANSLHLSHKSRGADHWSAPEAMPVATYFAAAESTFTTNPLLSALTRTTLPLPSLTWMKAPLLSALMLTSSPLSPAAFTRTP